MKNIWLIILASALIRVEALRARVAAEGVTERLKQELMDTAVRAIRIGAGSTITLQFINGQTVSVEEETK